MKKIEEMQYTLMYASRLIYSDESPENLHQRCIVFTIHTKTLYGSQSIKKAVFEKVHKAIYGCVSSPGRPTISVFIASDVESSRIKYVSDDVLQRPIVPHFHGLIVFNENDWDAVSEDIEGLIERIKHSIMEIKEVKPNDLGEGGGVISESVWMQPFHQAKHENTKHKFPLGNYIQYCMKAHLQACTRGMDAHEPSVFPFDAYASEADVTTANALFSRLWAEVDN